MVKYLRTGILDLLVSVVIRSHSVNGLTCKCRIPIGSRSWHRLDICSISTLRGRGRLGLVFESIEVLKIWFTGLDI